MPVARQAVGIAAISALSVLVTLLATGHLSVSISVNRADTRSEPELGAATDVRVELKNSSVLLSPAARVARGFNDTTELGSHMMAQPERLALTVVGKDVARSNKTHMLFMFGDSTMRQQYDALLKIKGWAPALTFRANYKDGMHHVAYHELKRQNERYSGWAFNYSVAHFQHVSAQIGPKPSVVYFNDALHYLHLEPYRRWGGYSRWKNAEALAQTFVLNAKQAFGSDVRFIFMKSHAVCTRKFNGKFAKGIFELESNPTAFAQACARRRPFNECLESTFTSDGVHRLNSRVWNAIRGMVHGVVDAYAITDGRCDYTKTGDGRHYPSLVSQEIDSLVIQIELATKAIAELEVNAPEGDQTATSDTR